MYGRARSSEFCVGFFFLSLDSGGVLRFPHLSGNAFHLFHVSRFCKPEGEGLSFFNFHATCNVQL